LKKKKSGVVFLVLLGMYFSVPKMSKVKQVEDRKINLATD
jgi:hypothetical protein